MTTAPASQATVGGIVRAAVVDDDHLREEVARQAADDLPDGRFFVERRDNGEDSWLHSAHPLTGTMPFSHVRMGRGRYSPLANSLPYSYGTAGK